jgi:hypothetical protein
MPDYLGEETHYKAACSELSGLSIYQPRGRPGQGEFPCFLGFCACFLEFSFELDADCVYILYVCGMLCVLVVVFTEQVLQGTPGR